MTDLWLPITICLLGAAFIGWCLLTGGLAP
jgi:hypothetical protein